MNALARVLLAALLVLPATFTLSMGKGLTHDEQQHLAAGALLAQESLLPYRDFPDFHTPHLVFVYGALFRSGSYFLLKARVFSAVCAAFTAGVLFAAAWHALRRWNPRARWMGSLSALALLLCCPLFGKASGQAWNQDPSMLCALAGVVLLLAASEMKRQNPALLASGVLLGLAVGFRITWAPIALPMLGVIVHARRRVVNSLAVFSRGALLGLAPLIWLFVIAPEQTLFGNFEFPKVNVLYRLAKGEERTMTFVKKAVFFAQEIIRPELALVALLALTALVWWRAKNRATDALWLPGLLALLPFILLGSFAPSPLFSQYFYAPVPFAILAAVFALAAAYRDAPGLRSAAPALLAGVAVSVAVGARNLSSLDVLFSPAAWVPVQCHAAAQPLRAAVPPGRVLTLAPLHALEAGCKIYPAFSTGPFAWRVARFVAPERRAALRLVSPDELADYLRPDPPAAILLGEDPKGEKLFTAYAAAHGYLPASPDQGGKGPPTAGPPLFLLVPPR